MYDDDESIRLRVVVRKMYDSGGWVPKRASCRGWKRLVGLGHLRLGGMVELSLDICVLSVEEAGRLENYSIFPSCKKHLHMKRSKAEAAVKAATHRYIGGNDTSVAGIGYLSMIVPTYTSKMWEPVACHGYDGKAIAGMRSWGVQPTR